MNSWGLPLRYYEIMIRFKNLKFVREIACKDYPCGFMDGVKESFNWRTWRELVSRVDFIKWTHNNIYHPFRYRIEFRKKRIKLVKNGTLVYW